MRRPAGIVFAAGVLAVIAAFGVLGTIFGIVVLFLLRHTVVPNIASVRIVLALVNAAALAAFLWGIWTAVGLIRLRRWARYSVLAIGFLDFVICGLASAGLLIARKSVIFTALAASRPPGSAFTPGIALLVSAVFYSLIALVGVWWMVYFSLGPVRRAFVPVPVDFGAGVGSTLQPPPYATGVRGASPYGIWRGVVIAFACILLLGVPSLILMATLHIPVFIFGAILRGGAAATLLLAFAAIQLLIGVGLLRRSPAAYWTALGWQVYSLSSTLLLLIPAYTARLMVYLNTFSSRFTFGVAQPATQMLPLQRFMMVMGGIMGVAGVLFFSYALIRCRRYYLAISPR
jgi:hypothetical protein